MADEIRKVKSAVHAAESVKIRAGSIPVAALFEKNQKIDKIREILKPFALSDEAQYKFIRRVQAAAIDLHMSKNDITRGEKKARLRKFHKKIQSAINAWDALGGALQESIFDIIEDREIKISADRYEQALERSQRIRQVIGHDIHAAIDGVRELGDILKSDSSQYTFEYQFCIEVCRAWHLYTGEVPSVSRNVDEGTLNRSIMPFERLICVASAPCKIGERIVRDAHTAFKASVGDKS